MLNIPAGMLDDNIEFFNHPSIFGECYYLQSGQVTRVIFAGDDVSAIIDADMAIYPTKVEALIVLGFEAVSEQREKYCSCCFGAYDANPDVINGQCRHNEYVPCIMRGSCPVEGILCSALKVGDDKILSPREIEVLRLAGRCLLDKEIASQLDIAEQTVKVHLRHIREKSGLMNKKDLVLLAHQKNLA